MQRVYFTLSTVNETQKAVDELLLARIGIEHIYVVAKEGAHTENLPQAPLLIKTDLRHSLIVGVLLGGLMGVGAGLAFHYELGMALSGLMAVTTGIGALFGAWAASMIGMVAPNRELAAFQDEIEQGKMLLIVDVPSARRIEIEDLVSTRHPGVILIEA